MKRHSSEEAYYQRLKELAEVNKPALKENNYRNLGTLIDYKRAADGIAYGIIKENHNYYIKKAGTKQDPSIADFAYIGGQSNITEFQYSKLSEADKHRNMIFHTINEATSLKPNKNGSKKKLNEDVAGDEIEQAKNKLGDLDTATSAEETPEPPMDDMEMPEPEGGEEEMPMPEPDGGEEEMPIPDDGEEIAPEPEGGEEEVPEPEVDGEGLPVVDVDDPNKEIEKSVGKITNKIRKTEMTDSQVKSYINSFISAFKDKLPEIEIEDRKEMANKLIKVVDDDEIDDLEQSMSDDEITEDQCVECGGFGKYAESRGYDSPESFMECDDDEKSSVVSGYANAHEEGQNDGDLETLGLVIKLSPEILNQLKGDYGHEEYAEKLTPYTDSLNETTEEDAMIKLNELWGELGGGLRRAASGLGTGIADIGRAAMTKAKEVGGNVKQDWNKGVQNIKVNQVTKLANELKSKIELMNAATSKAGGQPISSEQAAEIVGNIIKGTPASISNNVGAQKAWNVGKKNAFTGQKLEGFDPANTEVQPNMLKEDDDNDEELNDIENDNIENDGNIDDFEFNPSSQSLGVGVVKPDGAPTSVVDVNVDAQNKTINIAMNEAKRKLIKQIAESVNGYMNELSTGTAIRASNKAGSRSWNSNDEFEKAKLNVQDKSNFSKYINPDLTSFLKSKGINAERNNDGITLEIPNVNKPDDFVYMTVDMFDANLSSNNHMHDISPDIARILPAIIKRIKADLKLKKQDQPSPNELEESKKPSAGLSKEKKGEIVKKAKKGEDIGKKGKGFEKVEKKAEKEYGSEEIGKKVAAAAMWKNVKREGKEEKETMTESELKLRKYVRNRLEENAGLRKSTLNESKKSDKLKQLDNIIDKQFKLYGSVTKK